MFNFLLYRTKKPQLVIGIHPETQDVSVLFPPCPKWDPGLVGEGDAIKDIIRQMWNREVKYHIDIFLKVQADCKGKRNVTFNIFVTTPNPG